MSETTLGAHHLTPENIGETIRWLESIEDGTCFMRVEDVDWLTKCGVLAMQMRHLMKNKDVLRNALVHMCITCVAATDYDGMLVDRALAYGEK